jgi:hypothetical protein
MLSDARQRNVYQACWKYFLFVRVDNPAKTKSEVLAYLRDSLGMMDKAIAATNSENLLQPDSGVLGIEPTVRIDSRLNRSTRTA